MYKTLSVDTIGEQAEKTGNINDIPFCYRKVILSIQTMREYTFRSNCHFPYFQALKIFNEILYFLTHLGFNNIALY